MSKQIKTKDYPENFLKVSQGKAHELFMGQFQWTIDSGYQDHALLRMIFSPTPGRSEHGILALQDTGRTLQTLPHSSHAPCFECSHSYFPAQLTGSHDEYCQPWVINVAWFKGQLLSEGCKRHSLHLQDLERHNSRWCGMESLVSATLYGDG